MKVHYTEEAEDDLDEIAIYTTVTWGDEQCDWYLDMLEQTCERIIPGNLRFGLARKVPHREGVLRWRAEHHYIYFREVSDGIEVIRILHERQVPEHHL